MFQTIARHVDELLENENWFSLNKLVLAELIALCQERGLPTEGDKKMLIQELLDYKTNVKPIPAPSTPHLISLDPPSPSRRNIINSINFQNLFQDDSDMNGVNSGDIPFDKLELGKKLGSGGFKDCYAGTYQGEPVAIGELRITQFTELDLVEIKHEINVLKQLRHENIVRFIGVCTNPKHLCIITELCENGDLFDYMRKAKKPGFCQEVMFMHDIALGVSYLHTRRFHPISAPRLTTLAWHESGRAQMRRCTRSAAHPIAPEFWSANPSYTEKIYACALIFWEILSWAESGYPYQDMTEHVLYAEVRDRGTRPSMRKLAQRYPQSLLVLIQEMWQKEPSK
ncbi:kinase-like domain-containing protein, partial [Endogone sp. FLAS-F59071]